MSAAAVTMPSHQKVGLPIVNSTGYQDLQMILDLDEDCGANHNPYILTNETNLGVVRGQLETFPKKEKAFHIGVSCLYNFDIMCARDSKGALLIDTGNRVYRVHQITEEYIANASTRQNFIFMITAYFEARGLYRFGCNSRVIEAELEREGGWLSSDENFEKIKALYQNKKIIHLRVNLCDTDKFQVIRRWVDNNNLDLDSLYLSNVKEWVTDWGLFDKSVESRQMDQSVRTIADLDTHIIDAFYSIQTTQLFQRIVDVSAFRLV